MLGFAITHLISLNTLFLDLWSIVVIWRFIAKMLENDVILYSPFLVLFTVGERWDHAHTNYYYHNWPLLVPSSGSVSVCSAYTSVFPSNFGASKGCLLDHENGIGPPQKWYTGCGCLNVWHMRCENSLRRRRDAYQRDGRPCRGRRAHGILAGQTLTNRHT